MAEDKKVHIFTDEELAEKSGKETFQNELGEEYPDALFLTYEDGGLIEDESSKMFIVQ